MLTVLLIKKINKFQRLNASSCLSLVFLPCTTYLYYLVIEAKPPETLVSIKWQKSSCTCVILFISLLTHQCLDLWRKKKKNVNVVISRNKWETLSTLLGTLGSCVKPDQVVSVNGNSSNMSSKDNLCSYITDHTMLYNFKFIAEWQRSRKSCHPPLFVFNLFYI